MQHTTKWDKRVTALAVLALFSSSVYAEENKVNNDEQQSILSNIGGSFSLAYNTNIYSPSDYRSVRSLSWNGSLNYGFTDNMTGYISSGGYRAYENETGDFATDSIIGASYSNLFTFGETGKVGLRGQLTIPTSETSRDTELYTALRVDVPISFEMLGGNYSVSPRVRKNFYKYKTMNGRVLTEWAYSLSVGANYQFDKLTLGASALGGNGMSYKGNRSKQFTYGASVFSSYQLADSWSASLSASTAGFYTDAERGTLGDIDLFDEDKATYTAQLSFSF